MLLERPADAHLIESHEREIRAGIGQQAHRLRVERGRQQSEPGQRSPEVRREFPPAASGGAGAMSIRAAT